MRLVIHLVDTVELRILQVSDLKNLMQQYEHWANRLYPKFTFKDVTQRIERLSTTKDFKVCDKGRVSCS